MSIFSQLIGGKITFSQAASQFLAWAERLISHDAVFTQAASDALSIVKQRASDALTLGDTALSSHANELATVVETAMDKALAAATGGLSTPLNPLIDAGVDQLMNLVVGVAHAKALEFKASLVAGPSPAPPQSGPAAQAATGD